MFKQECTYANDIRKDWQEQSIGSEVNLYYNMDYLQKIGYGEYTYMGNVLK